MHTDYSNPKLFHPDMANLSTRARAALFDSHHCWSNPESQKKENILRSIRSNTKIGISPLRDFQLSLIRVRGSGRKTIAEIFTWLGIPEQELRDANIFISPFEKNKSPSIDLPLRPKAQSVKFSTEKFKANLISNLVEILRESPHIMPVLKKMKNLGLEYDEHLVSQLGMGTEKRELLNRILDEVLT